MVYINGTGFPYTENQNIQDYTDTTPYIAAAANHKIVSLDTPAHKGEDIQLLDANSKSGFFCYRQTLFLIMALACREVTGNYCIRVRQSINKATFCQFINGQKPTAALADSIKVRMQQIIDANLPIEKVVLPRKDAVALLQDEGNSDSAEQIQNLARENLTLYKVNNRHFFMDGVLAVRTGSITKFDFTFYGEGFLLRYPNYKTNGEIPPFESVKQLTHVVEQFSLWDKVLSVDSVSTLNTLVEKGNIYDMILMQEGLHEKRIAQIADEIKAGMPDKKIILITGPSSSGKTTFSEKLGIQLRVNGIKPIKISLDDYYVDIERTLKNEDGSFNFEEVESIDYQLFNEHIMQLIQGNEVEVPVFSFATGRRLPHGKKMRLGDGEVAIIEGIHAHNDRLTPSVDAKYKFKIYISPLTELAIDGLNPISPTDTRLIRRLVRDYNYRCSSAQNTFDMWPSVQDGEVRNIFPYEEHADVVFNSAILYEFCVLKRYAEPILNDVPQSSIHYPVAQKLLEIFSAFTVMEDYKIPSTSLMREFIGGSIF